MLDGDESWLVVDTAGATTPGGRRVRVLWICGEVDMATRTVLEAALALAVDQRPRRIVLDCTGMAFCDGGGLAAVMRTVARGTEQDTEVAVVGLAPRLAHLCALLWRGPQPVRCASVGEAVSRAARPQWATRGRRLGGCRPTDL